MIELKNTSLQKIWSSGCLQKRARVCPSTHVKQKHVYHTSDKQILTFTQGYEIKRCIYQTWKSFFANLNLSRHTKELPIKTSQVGANGGPDLGEQCES